MNRVGATVVLSPFDNIRGWRRNRCPCRVQAWKSVLMKMVPDKDVIMKLSALLPPPASSIRSVHCAGCGTKNGGQRKYCGKCGNHLWDPCINCGESNSAEEEFCGSCGTNLKAALGKMADRIDKDIAQARFLMTEYLYAEAISLLKPITAIKHSRLARAASRASNLFEQCLNRRQELTPRIRKIEEDIKQFIACGDLDQAARKADEIPEALRSRDLCRLIKESQCNRAEITELNKALNQLKDGSLTVDLVDKVERLLTLQPGNDDARKQAQAINRGAMRKSKRIATAGDYEKALGLLDQVPKAFLDDEFRNFRDQISELAYLAWDIKHAPRLDGVLFEFAGRLRKYVSENDELKKLCKELASRESGFQPCSLGRKNWSERPRETIFGAPLEFLHDLGPVHIGPTADCSVLAENPGRYAAACGLALQGLGRASLQIDLLSKKTIIGKISRWLPKRPAQTAWGVEISLSGIKAVKLASDDSTGNVVFQECKIVEHRRLLKQSSNDKDRDLLVDETLQNFLKPHGLDNAMVVLGLPDWMVLLKTVELPPMPVAKREAAITHEARHLFATPLPDVTWKHAVFDAGEDNQPQRPVTVVYIGLRRTLLQRLLTRWQKFGLKVEAVQCDILALYNFAMFQQSIKNRPDSHQYE